jgi:hypothetical protein
VRLSRVSFCAPIPIPGTHIRQAEFSALDGWVLNDDDGRITLSRLDVRFHTYVDASCVEAIEPETPPAAVNYAKKGRR